MEKSLLQTKEWASLRQGFGWQAYNIESIYILEKKLPFGKSFLYAPEVNFEEIDSERSRRMSDFLSKIQNISQKPNSVFLRLEILDQNDDEITQKLLEFGFIKAFEEIQPEFRQIIPINKSEEEILAGMKQKGRYNIKIAQKNGIKVVIAPSGNCDKGETQSIKDRHDATASRDDKSDNTVAMTDAINIFYQMFLETAKRDGFSIRPKDYFQNMLEILSAQGYAELLIAYYENKPVAAEIISYYDGVASYLYGASSNEYRNLMAPYLLHFEAIKRAKEKGCKIYDLLAVAPMEEKNGEQVEISGHKYAGISRFKRQFGGETICLVGSYDLVFQPFWYKIFKIAEKIRRR